MRAIDIERTAAFSFFVPRFFIAARTAFLAAHTFLPACNAHVEWPLHVVQMYPSSKRGMPEVARSDIQEGVVTVLKVWNG
jgi:hypothetical protein